MEPINIVISAEYSEFRAFLDDFLFRIYGRHAKKVSARNGRDSSTHLSYTDFGVIFDYKIINVDEGLDIELSYWAEVISDENKENIQTHIKQVVDEIRKKFRSGDFPLGFKNLVIDIRHAEVMENLWVESQKAQKAGAYLSTIIILGSILEGLLLFKIMESPENMKKANQCASSPKDRDTKKVLSFDKWSLADLIVVSHKCGWINEYSYNYSNALRKHRNFVHPFFHLDELFTLPDEPECVMSRNVIESVFKNLVENK